MGSTRVRRQKHPESNIFADFPTPCEDVTCSFCQLREQTGPVCLENGAGSKEGQKAALIGDVFWAEMKQGHEHIHKQNQVSLVSLKFLLSFLIPYSVQRTAQPQPAKQFHAERREVVSFVCCMASLTYPVIKMLITKQFKYMTDNAVKAYS